MRICLSKVQEFLLSRLPFVMLTLDVDLQKAQAIHK
jgi:hypothetical protein